MSHVLLKARVPDGIMYFCECSRLMGILKRPYSEEALSDLIQGHRQHVLVELEVPDAWRIGHTERPLDLQIIEGKEIR